MGRFQGLLKLCLENPQVETLPEGTRQSFRWANDLTFQDSEARLHTYPLGAKQVALPGPGADPPDYSQELDQNHATCLL